MRHSAKLGLMLAPMISMIIGGQTLTNAEEKRFNELRGMLPTSDGKIRHGKGKQAKPAKRTNRGNVSARVRRKHRRAA